MKAPLPLVVSIFTAGSLLTANGASADVGFQELHPFRVGLLIDLGYGKLDTTQARNKSIGDSGFAFGGSLNADVFDLVSLGASAGTVFVDDNAEFEQGVVNLAGEATTAESTLNVNLLALSAGLRTPTLRLDELSAAGSYPGMWLFARYGKSWQGASRSIANCGDCDSEDIALGDGPFLDSGLMLGLINDESPLGLLGGVGYRLYFDDAAARYSITAKVGFSLF